MKRFDFILFVFLVCCLMMGCRSAKPIATDTLREVSRTEVVRDTLIKTEGDTARAVYLIKEAPLPPEGEIVEAYGHTSLMLEKVGETKGKHLRAPDVAVKDGKLIITVVAEPQAIPVQVKDSYTTESTEKTHIVTTNELTGWQRAMVWTGSIFLGLLVVLVIVQVLRVKKVLKF